MCPLVQFRGSPSRSLNGPHSKPGLADSTKLARVPQKTRGPEKQRLERPSSRDVGRKNPRLAIRFCLCVLPQAVSAESLASEPGAREFVVAGSVARGFPVPDSKTGSHARKRWSLGLFAAMCFSGFAQGTGSMSCQVQDRIPTWASDGLERVHDFLGCVLCHSGR